MTAPALDASSPGTGQPRPLVVTRFAPSPTGHLHVGGARSALFCWAYARHARLAGADGRFMIRIEDTDQSRSSDDSAKGILEDLAWLGIDWDDGPPLQPGPGVAGDLGPRSIGGDSRRVGPYFQARRLDLYNAYIHWLVHQELAYPAFESAQELEAKRRAAVADKQTYRYDRAALRITLPQRLEKIAAGESHVIRFRAPDDAVTVRDLVLGDVTYAPGEMDDFVIRKADGFPTYHFAVVIDDELMGVTHVLRAQEHLANTPRHVAMQRVLRRLDTGRPFLTPVYAHMPVIYNMDGTKMSKRDKAKTARKAAKDALQKDPALRPVLAPQVGVAHDDMEAFLAADNDSLDIAQRLAARFNLALPEIEVSDFRAAGYLPGAIVNFLSLLGWNPGQKDAAGKDVEKFDMPYLAAHFSIERIGRANAKFDRAKLLSFNADALQALPPDRLAGAWARWAEQHDPAALAAARSAGLDLSLLALAVRPRCRTLRDVAAVARFALIPDGQVAFDPRAVEKHLRGGTPPGLDLLEPLAVMLAAVEPWEPATLSRAVDDFAAARTLPMGSVAQALRVALTGVAVSPGLGETLALLGRAATLNRLRRCQARCASI